jgi:ABC-type Fe3+-hydroxamate transport system substrate-binding protein
MWKKLTDQTGYQVALPKPPERIISLVPSQTELLQDLGLGEKVVGITKFCVHPEEWFRGKPRVGGTKNPRIGTIRDLAPDLVIANKEENRKEDVEAIRQFCPVWTSDVQTIEQALAMIRQVGEITDREEEAARIAGQIGEGLGKIVRRPGRVAYLIWKDPWMAAGSETFIDSVMATCGWENVFGGRERYPEVSLEEMKASSPEVLLLSSEPYPFKIRHLEYLRLHLPNADIRLVDGEMFSWYGSRMRLLPGYLEGLGGRIEDRG